MKFPKMATDFLKRFADSIVNSNRNKRKKDVLARSVPEYPTSETLETLVRIDWILRRACEKMPTDAFSKWIDITTEKPETLEIIKEKLAEFDIKNKVIKAGVQNNIYGGAVLIIGAVDGQTTDQPLDMKRVTGITAVNLAPHDDVSCWEYDEDKLSPNYGLPIFYEIDGQKFHHSRVAVMRGFYLNREHLQERNGFGDSKIYSMQEAAETIDIVNTMVQDLSIDFSTKIFKVDGMMDKLISPEGQEALQTRFDLANESTANDGAVLIGDNEEFSYITRTLSGIDNLSNFAIDMMSGAAQIPKTKLFGQQLGTLSGAEETTGDYIADIESYQESIGKPVLKKILDVFFKVYGNSEKYSFEFNPYKQPTQKELVEMQKTAGSTVSELYIAGVIELDESRKVFDSTNENWILTVDPNRKVEKQEGLANER